MKSSVAIAAKDPSDVARTFPLPAVFVGYSVVDSPRRKALNIVRDFQCLSHICTIVPVVHGLSVAQYCFVFFIREYRDRGHPKQIIDIHPCIVK